MNGIEFNITDVITIGSVIVGMATVVITNKITVKFLNEKIDRLEKKQDKHNGLIERMVKAEQSTSSAHHRLDENETEKKNLADNISKKLDNILKQLSDHVEKFHLRKE